METGDLTVKITLLEPERSPDADGNQVIDYVDRGSVWANMQHRPGSEAFQQARMAAKDPATVAVQASPMTMRITSEWKIATRDSIYELKGNPFLTQDRAFLVFQVEGRRK